MAEETITRLIDDLDRSEATQKVLLGLNGEWRGLDLSDKNHGALLKNLEKFWNAASPVRGQSAPPAQQRRTRGPAKAKADRGYDITQLREWAAEKGVSIPSRGRIAGATVEQFQNDVTDGWRPSSA